MSEYIAEVVQSQYGEVKIVKEKLTRCKDCKYWGANGYRYGCINATPIMMENDYCSNAERKEE